MNSTDEVFSAGVRRLIDAERWTFAKTMSQWPHEYLVRDRVDGELFEELVKHIRANGYEGHFYQTKITYYDEDGLMYWTMGAPLKDTTIINRCRKEDSFEVRSAKGTLPSRIGSPARLAESPDASPARLVISRKGFDSTAGGYASPILSDGQMLSLPIPDLGGNIRYSGLHTRSIDVGHLVSDLTRGSVSADATAHLDPDLEPSARSRKPGWLPAFGQDSNAQRHLDGAGVDVDDLFLFFGWFRDVEIVAGKYQYCANAPDLHVLFGWLRIGQIIRLGPDPIPDWLMAHPHAVRDGWPFNTVYVGKSADGGGVFPTFSSDLVLTEAGKTRSLWRLPSDFMPRSRPPLTYHESPSRWTETEDGCQLWSAGRGQEFVLNLEKYPGVQQWAEELIRTTVTSHVTPTA